MNIVKAFYEAWCPLTNTLLTSFREMLISLYNMRVIDDLLIRGKFYDEMDPSVHELTGTDETGAKFVSRSCKCLFHAFHKLYGGASTGQSQGVSIIQWLKFWCNKAMKYHAPPARREKRVICPKSITNPSRDIELYELWSASKDALFANLNISGGVREEAYLAAFLSCWFCGFVALFSLLTTLDSYDPIHSRWPAL